MAVLLASCLAACTVGRETAGPLPAEFHIALEPAENVPPGRLYFKPIPGGLLGRSADSVLFRSMPGASDIRVSTQTLSAGADAHAQRLRDDRANPGELANPRDLRIARIGAFYAVPADEGECSNFRTGLGLAGGADTLLVYVDRAATVRGQRYTAPWIMDYQLVFPRAGVYVIAMQAEGAVITQRTVTAAEVLQARVQRLPCG